jgi:hypothetical protein
LLLIEQDLRAGLLVDRFTDFLSDDFSRRGLVYTIGLWPDHHQP